MIYQEITIRMWTDEDKEFPDMVWNLSASEKQGFKVIHEDPTERLVILQKVFEPKVPRWKRED